MIDQINNSLKDYYQKWTAIEVDGLAGLKPVAVGWKVADATEYQQWYAALREDCDKTVETWMNGRWIAKLHLKDSTVEGGVTIIKLMQRRPGSDDALGLDHVDFMCADVTKVETYLQGQTAIRWTRESNDAVDDYSWISVWFDGGEAKIKPDTVIDIVIQELRALNDDIKSARG